MTTSGTMLHEGDWVSGTSLQDEKFIGYVESVNEEGTVRIRLTQCDRTRKVGMVVVARANRVMKLEEEQSTDMDELSGLIELALITRDEEWFRELSGRQLSGAARPRQSGTTLHNTGAQHNRFSGDSTPERRRF